MVAFTTKDFAAILDEAIAQAEAEERPAPRRATIAFEMLSEGAIGKGAELPDADAAAEYLFAMAGIPALAPEEPPAPLPALPPIEPEAIARELNLSGRETPDTLDRMRREFAFANHPDRVAPDLRERAIVRMQIANRMIDDAKARRVRA